MASLVRESWQASIRCDDQQYLLVASDARDQMRLISHAGHRIVGNWVRPYPVSN